ncbi:hypothetical protein [Nitrococcus mobilis]|nr:hypothetical protein [Nitrococcus mobilis]
MHEFPKRTIESDLRAFLVKRALDGNRAPQNYMICVVATSGGQVAVAASGGNGALLLKVASQSNWQRELASLELSKSRLNNVQRIIRHFERLKDPDLDQVQKVEDARKELKGNEIASKVNRVHERLTLPQTIRGASGNAPIADRLVPPTKENRLSNSLVLDTASAFGRRDCAEPRALDLAASTGERITGMTTIWYGRPDRNGYLDPLKLADVTISAAVPCEWCRSNERRIMMAVTDKIAAANPSRPNLQRRYSI